MKSTEARNDDMAAVYAGVIALIAIAAFAGWTLNHTILSYLGLKWAWYQLGLLDFAGAPPVLHEWRLNIASLAATPEQADLKTLWMWLNRAGYVLVPIPVLLTVRGIIATLRHPSNFTSRRITAATMPKIMSKHSPAVIPVLQYGDLLNTDPIEHRRSLNPEEWVAANSLLVNGALDRSKCLQLLQLNLGKRITQLAELAPHERALFAVFGARLFADGSDHAAAQQLLDVLNRSCRKRKWHGRAGYPDLKLADKAFKKYASHPQAETWLAKHPYPRTLLHSMHKEALAFGRLPSAHFRWLKGMDRPLWYALNTTGRKAPFMESAAVFTQALWESFADKHGYRLAEPCLDAAVDGIEAYLAKIGLLAQHTRD